MDTSLFATKTDLAELRGDMRTGFAEVRTEMHQGFGELRTDVQKVAADLHKWMLASLPRCWRDRQQSTAAGRSAAPNHHQRASCARSAATGRAASSIGPPNPTRFGGFFVASLD